MVDSRERHALALAWILTGALGCSAERRSPGTGEPHSTPKPSEPTPAPNAGDPSQDATRDGGIDDATYRPCAPFSTGDACWEPHPDIGSLYCCEPGRGGGKHRGEGDLTNWTAYADWSGYGGGWELARPCEVEQVEYLPVDCLSVQLQCEDPGIPESCVCDCNAPVSTRDCPAGTRQQCARVSWHSPNAQWSGSVDCRCVVPPRTPDDCTHPAQFRCDGDGCWCDYVRLLDNGECRNPGLVRGCRSYDPPTQCECDPRWDTATTPEPEDLPILIQE